ncbi:MAG: Spy/CpxP family protein refolding chaperone [Devosia sp.]
MKTSSTALAALLVAAIGSSAIVPLASAQETTPPAPAATAEVQDAHFRPDRMMRMERGRGPGELLNLVCSPDGAEALEVALVRLSHRLELTDAQQPLFDALKSSALTAQTSFADSCATARPAEGSSPDLIDGIKSRIAVDTVRLEAMNAVLPDLEKLFDSLTDAQRANLMPERFDRMQQRDNRDMGPGRYGRAPAPGRG